MALDSTQVAAIAGCLSIVAYLPYGYSVLRGTVIPQRTSWLIWGQLSLISFFSVLASGGSDGLLFLGAQMLGTNTIFLMSLWRGTGSLAEPADASVVTLSALGLALWWWTDNPAWAMGLSIAIGTLGGLLTVAKAFGRPHSEALSPWTLQWLAALLGVVSVIGTTALELAYPLYLFLLYSGIVGATLSGRVLSRRSMTNSA